MYLSVLWIHVLSAFLLLGTGFGSAFYKFMTQRSGDVRAIAVTDRVVVLADWMFTTPTVLIQPATGVVLLMWSGVLWSTTWVWLTLVLYAIAGACWLPVVWLQICMRRMAETAVTGGTALPKRYWRYARIWFWLGVPAFAAMLTVVGLMVFKPL